MNMVTWPRNIARIPLVVVGNPVLGLVAVLLVGLRFESKAMGAKTRLKGKSPKDEVFSTLEPRTICGGKWTLRLESETFCCISRAWPVHSSIATIQQSKLPSQENSVLLTRSSSKIV